MAAWVPPGVGFTLPEWRAQGARCLSRISQLGPGPYAVRSDAIDEDLPGHSLAGHYRSELNVAPDELAEAIDRVLRDQRDCAAAAVLVQEQVTDYRWVAVASTHRIADGAPWYCIDLANGDPALVTAGRANGRQLAIERQAWQTGRADLGSLGAPLAAACEALLRMLNALEPAWPDGMECELLVQDAATPALGVRLCLLQARALPPRTRDRERTANFERTDFPRFDAPDPIPAIWGPERALSLMADWNPAELLGSHPRPLALDLFRHCIADGPWWRARAALGYRPAPSPDIALLCEVDGRAFVDVRRSANSLLPADLPRPIGEALIASWIDRLRQQPGLHDKYEFELAHSATELAPERGEQVAAAAGLDRNATRLWQQHLADLTRGMLQDRCLVRWRHALRCWAGRATQQTPGGAALIDQLRCLRGAGRAFAALARLAFVAEAQLRSAERTNLLSADRALALRRAAGGMPELLRHLSNRQREQMRGGSFEISHPRWQPAEQTPGRACHTPGFAPTQQEATRLNQALHAMALSSSLAPYSAEHWVRFVTQSIFAREWGKFMLNQILGHTLSSIVSWGETLDLDVELLSFLHLAQIDTGMPAIARSHQGATALRQRAADNAAKYRSQQTRILAPLLTCPSQAFVADSQAALANFVGQHTVQAPLALLDHRPQAAERLAGKIVAIRAADPGYDWIFQCGIAGLITAWGGANSHMAIRCTEYGLPAAIGCGEAVFDRLQPGQIVLLDPLSRQLLPR